MQSFASEHPKCSKRSRSVKSLRSNGEPSGMVRLFQRPNIGCIALIRFGLVRTKENVFCTRLKASKNLNAYVHPYVVFENLGEKRGYTVFDPAKCGIEPLSLMTVCLWRSMVFPSCAMRPFHASKLIHFNANKETVLRNIRRYK
jgi:hypothetical protein